MGSNLTKETFIERARKVHGDKYDYSKAEYVKNSVKICIICPDHGEFWQTPCSHLNGNGCPACSNVKRLTKDVFVERSNKIHSNKYDYTKSNFVNIRTKVTITCPIHGDFTQTPKNHMKGQGCPKCGAKYAKEWRKNDYQNFINTSIERFGEIYEFPFIEDEYENSHSKITIRCKKCGNEFVKIACDHITSKDGGCGKCKCHTSFDETQLIKVVEEILPNETIRVRDRSILKSGELDIYIPKLGVAIEYNGIYWHSERMSNKHKNYHLMKTEECISKGIKLIQIFEDEFINHKDIVISKLHHLLKNNINLPKIYGRKCEIREINKNDANKFLSDNHIQGFVASSVYLGAYLNNILCGVMTFKKEKEEKWELTRFASDINYISCGVAGKLFHYFIRKYNPNEVKSFADRRWTTDVSDNLYTKLGFNFDKFTNPDYKYIKPPVCERFHKFGFRKEILHRKYNLPLDMTEKEMTESLGFYRIWDCGLIKYTWYNPKN